MCQDMYQSSLYVMHGLQALHAQLTSQMAARRW